MKMTLNENDNVVVTEDEKMGFHETNEPVVEKIVVIEGGCSSSVPPVERSLSSVSAPSFLIKTYNMVNDPKTSNLISWSVDGKSFIISDHNLFASELLPKHFRHNHFSSFIYQLNNYGFRKIEHDQWEYYHKSFRAGQPHLLEVIKRRAPTYKREDDEIKKVHAKIAKLKAENNTSRMELEKLKQRQEATEICKIQAQETLESAVKSFKTLLVDLIHELMDQMMREKRGPQEEGECSAAKKPRLDDDMMKQELKVGASSQRDGGMFLVEPDVAYEKLQMGESDEDDWSFRAITDDDVYDVKSRIFMEYQNMLGNQLSVPGGGGERTGHYHA